MTDPQLRLAGQVVGLEMALKMLISLHFAARVSSSTGFTVAADEAREIARELQAHVDGLWQNAIDIGKDVDTVNIMMNEVRETVARCFNQSASELQRVALTGLAGADPASDARN